MPRDVDFVLSSNPPNPKTSFRLGDWICSSPKCAAHNFGRNLSCIGCGSHRSPSSPARTPISSPRFSSTAAPVTPTPPPIYPSEKPSSLHPLLTPSGRAFAIGGKVQNISSDPLNPCVMFWPDNEPLPDQGQIRPSGLVGIPQPPILNTGNRGPISHQPGDWVCQKCNYLNWRRRKVCQTCLPYAEGNGDSISAAVQAERIALLTNVLARTRLDPTANFQQDHPSLSLTPPTESIPLLLDSIPPPPPHLLRPNDDQAPNKSVPRSRSHIALGQQYQHDLYQVQQPQRHLAPTPIYQTPLPSPAAPRFATELINPHPQHYHHHQLHRNPSPLPMPLLYSTGPPASPFLGANLGIPGYRMRVLSSPALPPPRDWSTTVTASSSPRPSGSSSGSGSIGSRSSLGSLDIPLVRIGESPPAGDDPANKESTGSELPTPAITSPLLPAFLRDVVSSSKSADEKEEEVLLGGRFIVHSPKALEGADLSPEEAVAWVRKSPSPSYEAFHSRMGITPLTKTNHPGPRARNDSGSSTCSTSSSSSSLSTSALSLSLSATSVSSGSGCCGIEAGDSLRNPPAVTRRRGSGPVSSSPSPTITTTVSSCPTPPADKGSTATGRTPAVPTPTSSLPFMSFGNTGIWKMDGEESKSLKGFSVPLPQQANLNRKTSVRGHESQALLP